MDIASPITAVKGIGEKTQKAFAKMGVYTVGDILRTPQMETLAFC